MTRMTALFLLGCLSTSVAAEVDVGLESQLEQYFEEVNVTALPAQARDQAWAVLSDEVSFQQTFLRLHSILERYDALVHVDMHGASHFQTAENK